MDSLKHIAVIGAGPSGLAAIKCCKEEGTIVTCFEKMDGIGGRWCFKNNEVQGVASVMKTTTSLHSKEILAFSDFPPPSGFPNYMHHTKMLEYLNLYAQTFGLLPHIKYRHEVVWISQHDSYEKTGKWLVTYRNLYNKTESSSVFDGVLICSGRLSNPFTPSYPTQDKFRGQVLHSNSIKLPTVFENLNVIVVGSGNSAVDVAVEVSTFAKQVYLSTRKGMWVFPKLGNKGLPFDLTLLSRYFHGMKCISNKAVNIFTEKFLSSKINHEAYRLKPNHRALDDLPTVNEDLPDKILTGRVLIKGKISSFEENGVTFEDDETSTKADVIIFATGYERYFSFLDEKFYKTIDGTMNLYKHVFPLGLKHSTLAVIGFIQTNGPTAPISELQCRWATKVFTTKLNIPTKEMLEINSQKNMPANNKTATKLEEDYVSYMDELANLLKAKPNFSSLLFKDPNLYWFCVTGPLLPYQYRLVGPHTWDGARQAILECQKRVSAPLEQQFTLRNIQMKNLKTYEKLQNV